MTKEDEIKKEQNEAKDKQQIIKVKKEYNAYKNIISNNDVGIYKRNNAAFDYSQNVRNELDPEKLGILKEPYIDVLWDNIFKLPKYVDAMLNHKIPSGSAVAGVDDISERDKKRVNIAGDGEPPVMVSMADIKKGYDNYENKRTPYNGFIKDMNKAIGKAANRNKLDGADKSSNMLLNGKYASSYFLHLGHCPSKKDERTCKNYRYAWKNDRCFKPRYGFVNNKGGSSFGDGILFSILKSIIDLNPLEVIVILMSGRSGSGSFIAPTCDELLNEEEKHLQENFVVAKEEVKKYYHMIIVILILISIIIIIKYI